MFEHLCQVQFAKVDSSAHMQRVMLLLQALRGASCTLLSRCSVAQPLSLVVQFEAVALPRCYTVMVSMLPCCQRAMHLHVLTRTSIVPCLQHSNAVTGSSRRVVWPMLWASSMRCRGSCSSVRLRLHLM